MKKFGLLAVVVAFAATAWITRGFGLGASAPADDQATFRTSAIARRDIGATVLATGVVRPRVGAEVQVGSRVSGILRRLHVTVGDRVDAGDLLAELDPTEFVARRDQASAQHETAVAEAGFARGEFDRAAQMLETGAVARAEFDAAKRAHDVAAARVRELEAVLASAEIQLGYTRIRAPISGVVAGVSTQVGETVAASFAAPTFVTIIDLERLEVWAYVDETDIGRIEVGQSATFTVDTYGDIQFGGTVSAIRPKAEIIDNVVNYVTLLDIGDRQGRTLRPEMTTTVHIVIDGRSDVLAIPNGAIRRDAEGVFALLPGTDGPVRRAIQTGYRGSDFTEILDGLGTGDEVIIGSISGSRP